MRLYEVNFDDGDPTTTYATKREAMKAARKAVAEMRREGQSGVITVDQIVTCRMDRATIIRLINCAGGYVTDRQQIAQFPVGDAEENNGTHHS